jgi:spermidine/putrescine-binding protein
MYNHRAAQLKVDKDRPSYELKIIMLDGENEIRRLAYLQQNYNPSDLEVQKKVQRLLAHLEKKYGNIANVRLATASDTLQTLIADEVYNLFGTNYKP